jgi:hypothetical protein
MKLPRHSNDAQAEQFALSLQNFDAFSLKSWATRVSPSSISF